MRTGSSTAGTRTSPTPVPWGRATVISSTRASSSAVPSGPAESSGPALPVGQSGQPGHQKANRPVRAGEPGRNRAERQPSAMGREEGEDREVGAVSAVMVSPQT